MAAHQACDLIVQEIRNELRGLTNSRATDKRELWDAIRPGGQKIVLVKLVSGLGCLYDTCLFPSEPAGYIGGKSIMDRSNNIQLVISPNEYRDGVLRSLT
jgi:D-proline reductase (dithiol) PrdD